MNLMVHPEIIENARRAVRGAQRLPLTLDPRLSTLDAFAQENLDFCLLFAYTYLW